MWFVIFTILCSILEINTILCPLVVDPEYLYHFTIPEDEVTFHLYYDESNTSKQLFIDKDELLESTKFNPVIPTKIIIHGWTHSKDVSWLKDMTKAMVQREEWNVIVVDWSQLAKVIYVEARIHTPIVAKQVANFCVFLQRSQNVTMSSLHLIGHSMGAQIAAFVGFKINEATGQKIGRITGLDPAAPLFEWPHMEHKDEVLDFTDATFVDVIHTNGRHLGMMTPAGHVDYYPNGGEHQPGCGFWICSHIRSCEFWTASIKKPDLFNAYPFQSWDTYLEGDTYVLPRYPMGIDASPDIPAGTYFLETDDEFKAYIDNTYPMSGYNYTAPVPEYSECCLDPVEKQGKRLVLNLVLPNKYNLQTAECQY